MKLSLNDISEAMNAATGRDREECDAFVRTLFGIAGEALVNGENIKIKGIGTFKITDVEARKSVNVSTGKEMTIAPHRKVTFSPDKALAEAVNEPFADYPTTEIPDGVSEADLEAAAAGPFPTPEQEPAHAPAPEPKQEPEPHAQPEPEPIAEPEPIPEPGPEPQPAPEPEPKSAPEPAPEPIPEPEPQSAPEIVPMPEPVSQSEASAPLPPEDIGVVEEPEFDQRRSHFWRGLWVGIGATIFSLGACFIILYFCFPQALDVITGTQQQAPEPAKIVKANPVPPKHVDTVKSEPVADMVATQPSDLPQQEVQKDEPKAKEEPKYDVIGKKRYLTTMAKEYYGNYNLWPLIYDANKGLGHPDRIRPGTKIRIPSASELGVNPADPAVVAKAKRRGGEIYAKYK